MLDPYSRQPEMLPCYSSLGEASWSELSSVHQQCQGSVRDTRLCFCAASSPCSARHPGTSLGPCHLLLSHHQTLLYACSSCTQPQQSRGLNTQAEGCPQSCPVPVPSPASQPCSPCLFYSPPFVLTTGPPPPCIMGAYADSSPPHAPH